MNASITFTRDPRRRLRDLDTHQLLSIRRQFLTQAWQEMVRQAARETPIETGRLVRDIQATPRIIQRTRHTTTLTQTIAAEYAVFVEYGTRHRSARLMISRAQRALIPKLPDLFRHAWSFAR